MIKMLKNFKKYPVSTKILIVVAGVCGVVLLVSIIAMGISFL